MNYPLISEYVEAIKAAEDNFDQLKHLRPVLGEDGEPVMTSGNFAVVFKMKDEQTGKLHAVKCFLKEQEGRAEAYRQIAEELEFVSSTFLTPIKYLDKELFVDSSNSEDSEFPVLLMDWVEGQTLDKYIREHIDDQYELSLLAYQFSRLAMWLMPQPFAHGDLKPDNILVKSDGTLVLVDYDGMYVPAMKGQKARELGSPDFRHPSRTETDFDEHIDDFSLASILLSLKAISLQPSLLEEYGAQDRLLFSANDYRNLSESESLNALRPLMQDAELASLYSLFILALSQNNLSQVSFRLFNLNRPERSQLDEDYLSTEVTEDDWSNAWTDEYGAHYSKDKKKVLGLDPYVEKYEIKEGTRCIADGAFSDFGAEIDSNNLQELTIPSTVITIGQNPFSFNIKKVICKSPYFEIDNKTLFTKGKRKLIQCYTQESVYFIPEGVEEIGDKAFYGCEVSKIVIPKSVKTIGNNPFAEMALYNRVLTVECNSPFFHVKDNCLIQEQTIISYWGKVKFFEVPLGTQVIGAFAFWVSNLQRIKLPSTITTIGEDAFHSQLEYIIVPVGEMQRFKDLLPSYIHEILVEEDLSTEVKDEDLANAWTDEYGVMYSVDRRRLLKTTNEDFKDVINHWPILAFAKKFGKPQLATFNKGTLDEFKGVVFTNPVDGHVTFVSFSSTLGEMTAAEIAAQKESLFVIQLEVDAETLAIREQENRQLETFVLCKSKILKDYSVIEGTEVICDKAFGSCKDVSSIFIPNSVKKLGNKVFDGCRNLSSIIIPDSVEVIGSWTFAGCSAMTEIVLPNSLKEIGRDIFLYCNKDLKIYIPHGELERFKSLLPKYADSLYEQNNDDANLHIATEEEKLEMIENYLLPDGSIYNGEGKVYGYSLELRGQGEIMFKNGDKYNGTFRYGRPLGWGKYTFQNGHTHRGYFDTYPKGIGYLNENYEMCVGNFDHGKLHGWGICYRNNIFKFGYWESGKLVKDETRRTLLIRYEITKGRFGYRGNLIQIGKDHNFIRYGIPEKLLASKDEFPVSLIPKLPAMGFEFFIDGTVKMGWINDHSSGDYVLYKPDGIIEMGKWNENIKTSDVSSFKTLPAKNEYVIDGIEVYKNT